MTFPPDFWQDELPCIYCGRPVGLSGPLLPVCRSCYREILGGRAYAPVDAPVAPIRPLPETPATGDNPGGKSP